MPKLLFNVTLLTLSKVLTFVRLVASTFNLRKKHRLQKKSQNQQYIQIFIERNVDELPFIYFDLWFFQFIFNQFKLPNLTRLDDLDTYYVNCLLKALPRSMLKPALTFLFNSLNKEADQSQVNCAALKV